MEDNQIIFFKYSSVYDRNWQIWKNAYKRNLPYEVDENFSPYEYVLYYNKKWSEFESKIITFLENTLSLSWNFKRLPCYIVRQGVAFSDPLTVPIKENDDDFFALLIHELIHHILTQNSCVKNANKKLHKEYQGHSLITINHIIVNAVMKKVYFEFFDNNMLEKDIEKAQNHQDYKKAWEIINSKGEDSIISSFISNYT